MLWNMNPCKMKEWKMNPCQQKRMLCYEHGGVLLFFFPRRCCFVRVEKRAKHNGFFWVENETQRLSWAIGRKHGEVGPFKLGFWINLLTKKKRSNPVSVAAQALQILSIFQLINKGKKIFVYLFGSRGWGVE